jgi:hypothetical protein
MPCVPRGYLGFGPIAKTVNIKNILAIARQNIKFATFAMRPKLRVPVVQHHAQTFYCLGLFGSGIAAVARRTFAFTTSNVVNSAADMPYTGKNDSGETVRRRMRAYKSRL